MLAPHALVVLMDATQDAEELVNMNVILRVPVVLERVMDRV